MLTVTDEYFLTIVKAGSLNKASQMLYVSQPSLSKYIQRLENKLGTELFDRTVAHLKLNEAGKLYLHFLQKQHESEIVLQDQLTQIKEMKKGTLKLGIPPYYGKYLLPRVLPRFSNLYPKVKVEIVEDKSANLDEALLSEEIDLAIHHAPVSNHELTSKTLKKEKIFFLTPKTEAIAVQMYHPKILAKIPEKFKAMNFILPKKGQKLCKIVEEYLSSYDFLPNVYARSSNMEIIVALVSVGLGVAFVPELGLDLISSDCLKKIDFYLLEDMISDWEIVSVKKKGTYMSSYEKDFLEIAKEA